MSRRAMSVAQAKATFSEAIRDVESGGTVLITRHGKAVAAIVRAEELDTIERLRAAGPEGGLASVAGGWEGSEELVDVLERAPRRGKRRTTLD
jgi:prevent-host-death family protein